jgi:pyrroline-5-carboxylate reductase
MAAAPAYRLGLIGAGNMGSALLRGFLTSRTLAAAQVLVWEVDAARRQAVAADLGLTEAPGDRALVESCEAVLLAVKPQTLPDLLGSLGGAFRPGQLVISIAAGVSLARLRALMEADLPLVRVMPNLLATVGESASVFACTSEVTAEQRAWVAELLGSVGLALPVEEKLLDAVTGLSGSGPAFCAVFCEALADGGVAAGLPRAVAAQLAAQTLAGAGRWMLEQGTPAQLKDAVTSPAGTTIAGLEALEEHGLRAAAFQAVLAAARRSAELGRDSGER